MPLQRLNWNERNYCSLQRFIAAVDREDIAVFDWDNTCIFGDIGEAVLRHQALHLAFKFGPERLREIIPDQVNGIGHVRSDGHILPLPEIKGRIVAAYEKVSNRPLAGVRASAPYRDFSAGLLALNHDLEQTPGIGCEFAYPWMVNFLQGFNEAEVRRLAAVVIAGELRRNIRSRCLSDSSQRLLYRWTAGIRPYPEMIDLAGAIKKAGGRVIVSTASNPQIVETMVQRTHFPADRVIGMASHSENGILQGAMAPGLAPNFGPGKARNLSRLLDREPVFIAGDSDGDYAMLTAFAGTRLKLLIRRAAPGRMAALYQKALAGDCRFLLQDVDQAIGRFSAPAKNAGGLACKKKFSLLK
jgi:phosphoserine phosphatase